MKNSKLSVSTNGALLVTLGLLGAMKTSNKIMNLTKSFDKFIENPASAIPATFKDADKVSKWLKEYAAKAVNAAGLSKALSEISADKISEEVTRMKLKLSKEVLNDAQALQLSNALATYENELKRAVNNAAPLVKHFVKPVVAAKKTPLVPA
jgi:hypothetical protein